MGEIKFDDVEALREYVSGEYGPFGREIEVTQDMINRFAELTGDHQWIHVDVERARKESPFGGPIAHGFLTLSLLPKLGGGDTDPRIVGFGNVTNYGADKLRFLSPVPAGAKIRARSRLVSVDAVPKGTRITREVAVHVVGNDARPALVYAMIVLFHPPRT